MATLTATNIFVRTVLAACVATLVFGTFSVAHADNDEIIVTAMRYEERYEDFTLPHVSIRKRADFAVASFVIESDTRDLTQRGSELRQALAELQRAVAASSRITVAIMEESDEDSGETSVRPFSIGSAELAITSGTRPDTSRVTLLLRTPVTASDTLDSIEERFDDFASRVSRPGRITLSVDEAELTLVNPAQYRRDVINAIGADARAAIASIGPNQAVEIEGLENRIAWRRTGDLELTIFIPHRLRIVAVDGGRAQQSPR
jgi:hypothetical protein